MIKHWINLRGTELAAFAASSQVLKEGEIFIGHLEKYGTPTDFNNAINQHEQPLAHCIKVYERFPQAAEQWLVNELKQYAFNNHTDTDSVYSLVVRAVTFNTVSPKILQHVRFNYMSVEGLEAVFPSLLQCNLKAIVEENWDAFKKIMHENSAAKVMEAAAVGLDLAAKLNWHPTPTNQDEYFVCCCKGGLLEQIKNLKITNPKTICDAFVASAIVKPANAPEVLNYLWDTYPNTPWHERNILQWMYTVCTPLTHKVMAHAQTHAPAAFGEMAYNIACNAALRKQTQYVKLFIPHVHPSLHCDVAETAVHKKDKPTLRAIMQTQGVNICPHTLMDRMPDRVVWLERFFNDEQAKVLQKNIAGSTISRKRKM